MWRTLIWFPAVSILVFSIVVACARSDDNGFSPYVDQSGAITLPEPSTVRAQWDFLGVYALQGDEGVREFHTVYTQPGVIEKHKSSGEFPDGAVLVKEVRQAQQGALTTGNAAWNSDELLWFVMIKDEYNRFPGNPLWANKWGWALFNANYPSTNTATDFEVDCMACHMPAQETEWVYKQGYPVLRDGQAQ